MFPAVVVFWDGKRHWLADGFHRYSAQAKIAKTDRDFRDIRCEVRPGTRRDAVIFSAGANKAFSIPRTMEDKKKATHLLLSDDEWFTKTCLLISKHVGVSALSVKKWRLEFCVERGIDPPAETVDANGISRKATSATRDRPEISRDKSRGEHYFVAHVGGRKRGLGSNREEAEKRLSVILGEEKKNRGVELESIALESVDRKLTRAGILCRRGHAHFHPRGGLGESLVTDAAVVISSPAKNIEELLSAIARVIINRAKNLPRGRAIVVCCGPFQCEVLDIARNNLGIEFMAPEELADSLKGEKSDAIPQPMC